MKLPKPSLRMLSLLALALFGSGQAATFKPADVSWVQLGLVERPSLLAVPQHCLYTQCALIVVSHPRGQTPERLRHSPQFSRMTETLLQGRFAVLLSSDGGPLNWGSPKALEEVGELHHEALKVFDWNGHTYALGVSMGGLMALRSTLSGSPYSVRGLALIDPWVNLTAAWKSSETRQQELLKAYGQPPSAALNPLTLALAERPIPLWVASSPDDQVVPERQNAALLHSHAAAGYSQVRPLTGPHLGGNRFTPKVASSLLSFFQALEKHAPDDDAGQ
ncbi:hypothetical protein Dxin01_00687 [Deinococcus xinjiangensis]|uniref:Alpha/beta hydrolase n=1 Tax=Deinococcus xinjiangensis TaxID=457454 RepID=A0ABP9V6Q3_9DEIO